MDRIADLILQQPHDYTDLQRARIGRNRDTCIAPKIPSLTPPILSTFSVESWLPAVNPLHCHPYSVCLSLNLRREGVSPLRVIKLECADVSLLSPFYYRLRWPSA